MFATASGPFVEDLGPVLESLHTPTAEPPRALSLEHQRQQRPQFRKQREPPRRLPPPPLPPKPRPGVELVEYRGLAGKLAAYLHPPKDRAQRHPAVVGCHGGFGGIGDAQWATNPSAPGEVGALFAGRGFVVLSPAWRGESGSDGTPEIFWGEVDNALSSIDYLASLPYVDPSRIYIAGHSAGATIAVMAGQRDARLRAVFSFGAALLARELRGDDDETDTWPFHPDDVAATWLRSPLAGIAETQVPTFLFEGSEAAYGAELAAERVAQRTKRPVSVFVLDGLDHWTAVPPAAQLVVDKAAADRGDTPIRITKDEVAAAAAKYASAQSLPP